MYKGINESKDITLYMKIITQFNLLYRKFN